MQDHNRQKKVALINDLSGFGRCSITVELPIISQMKIQCCPIPTAIFSNHTAYDSFYKVDFTDSMMPYIDEWKKLGFHFNGISSGYLSCSRQIDIVLRFIEEFKSEDTILLVDPVMGDDGKAYPSYDESLCQRMKELARKADILTPNLTEACILTDRDFHQDFTDLEICRMGFELLDFGADKIVITGIEQGDYIVNLAMERGCQPQFNRTRKTGPVRPGTGDIFSSIIIADAVNGQDFYKSVIKASKFIKHCLEISDKMELPLTDGVAFEEILDELK